MSNTEMVSVPRDKLQAWQERFSKAQIFRESSEVQALLAQPAEQHQGEPVAWIVKTKDGYASGPRAVLREQYDVEGPDFWYGGKPPRDAEITRLYKAPPACPDLCDVVLQILKVSVNIPDRLYARAKHLAKNPTAVEVATWKRRAIEAESKLRAYDSNLLADLFVDPKPSEMVLTKCRLCDQLQADLTARDEKLDQTQELLRYMVHDYRTVVQAGYDRITALGGGCDSVAKMLDDNPNYQKALSLLLPDIESRPEERGTPESEPCSGCGTPGWTGACNKCVPY